MGPMLGAILIGLFFLFAALSVCVAVVCTVLAVRGMVVRRAYLLGTYVLGSGLAGATAAVVFGLAMAWNVVGRGILEQGWLGYLSWGIIGYGWSTAAALVVGSLLGWLFRYEGGRTG